MSESRLRGYQPRKPKGPVVITDERSCLRCGTLMGRIVGPSSRYDKWACPNMACDAGTFDDEGDEVGPPFFFTDGSKLTDYFTGVDYATVEVMPVAPPKRPLTATKVSTPADQPTTTPLCATCGQPSEAGKLPNMLELRSLFYKLCPDLAPHETQVSLMANAFVLEKAGNPLAGTWVDWLRWFPEIAERARRDLNISMGVATPRLVEGETPRRVIELED